jgi:hypothetical protein
LVATLSPAVVKMPRMEPRPKIGFTRQVVAVLLTMAAVVTIPIGIAFLVAGFNGQLADAERSLNVQAGIIFFACCMLPPLALLAVLFGPPLVKRIRFSIRDLLWLTLLVAVLAAWWTDRQALYAKFEREKNPAYHWFEMKKQYDAQLGKAAAEREANKK